MYLSQKQLSSGGNKLLPETTNLTSWLVSPTTDGKTVSNIKGTAANLTGINTLDFDGNNDHIDLPSVPPEILSTGVFEIEMDLFLDTSSDTGYHRIVQFSSTGNAFFRIQKNTGSNTYQVWGRNSSSNNVFYDASIAFTGNTLFNLKVTGDGTNVVVKHDGVTVETISINTSNFDSNVTFSEPSISDGGNAIDGKVSNFKMTGGTTLHTHLPIQEGSGDKCYDISGNGNHGIITGATWSTLDGLKSHNTLNGFSSDIFKGYSGHWDLAASDSGTWVANESNLTLTGNTGTSGKFRQTVGGLSSGDTLVVSGTVVQTGGSGGGSDVAISSASAGWTQGTVYIGGAVSTYNFSTTLNANSSTCDIQFITVNSANVVISNLKFTVVKKIPALPNKTKQVVTLDGNNDEINTNYNPAGDLVIDCRFRLDSFSSDRVIHSCNGNSGYFFRVKDGEFQLYVGGGYVFEASADMSADSTTNIFDTRLELVDSTNVWTASAKTSTQTEYTLLGTGTRTPNFIGANVIIGQKGTSNYLDGEIHSFKLTSNGVTKVEYDFSGNLGTSTVLDISGNQNGTAHNVTTDLFWGKRIADSSGSLVSAGYNKGNTTISNPSGFVHNQSEVGFDLVSVDKNAASILAVDNANEDDDFAREDSNGNVIHYLQYSTGISDSTSLTRTRAYVG